MHHGEPRDYGALACVHLDLALADDVRCPVHLLGPDRSVDPFILVTRVGRRGHALPARVLVLVLAPLGAGHLAVRDILGRCRRGEGAVGSVSRVAVGGEVALVVIFGNLCAVRVGWACRVGLEDLARRPAHFPWRPVRSLRPDLRCRELYGTLVAHTAPLSVQYRDGPQALAHPTLLALALTKLGPFLDVLLLHELVVIDILELLDRWLDAVGAVARRQPCHLCILKEIRGLFIDCTGQILCCKHWQLVFSLLWPLVALLFAVLVLVISA